MGSRLRSSQPLDWRSSHSSFLSALPKMTLVGQAPLYKEQDNVHFSSHAQEADAPAVEGVSPIAPLSVVSFRRNIIFPKRLHQMLCDKSSASFSHIVTWLPNGSSFVILQPTLFMKKILPNLSGSSWCIECLVKVLILH